MGVLTEGGARHADLAEGGGEGVLLVLLLLLLSTVRGMFISPPSRVGGLLGSLLLLLLLGKGLGSLLLVGLGLGLRLTVVLGLAPPLPLLGMGAGLGLLLLLGLGPRLTVVLGLAPLLLPLPTLPLRRSSAAVMLLNAGMAPSGREAPRMGLPSVAGKRRLYRLMPFRTETWLSKWLGSGSYGRMALMSTTQAAGKESSIARV